MKHETQKFFDLPLEEKKKSEQSSGDTDGFGQLFVVSDEQKLDWADLFYLKTSPTYLRKPIFSKLYLSLIETMKEYADEIKKLSMKVLEMLGKTLGIDEKEVKSVFEEGMQSMRMNYYPPCPQPDKVMGLTPHSNGLVLTILFQVNGTQGPTSSLVTAHNPPRFKTMGATEFYRGYLNRELVGKSYVEAIRINHQ
ncbi:hypothetical protein MTR67_009072 [Solanum verrucosum]|uniref:Isopenicillin N synthase-like Fe(2+) 2OG dioxygenase domain-containing protein n=1 Tax=Solanum verrucosum TaxID=315347 RepID=A0AAF0Q2L0_SOLVR|nr:hypothetical protein MTR67_009072 [Solanum verrucosum]